VSIILIFNSIFDTSYNFTLSFVSFTLYTDLSIVLTQTFHYIFMNIIVLLFIVFICTVLFIFYVSNLVYATYLISLFYIIFYVVYVYAPIVLFII
jgi:hypothetical protein